MAIFKSTYYQKYADDWRCWSLVYFLMIRKINETIKFTFGINQLYGHYIQAKLYIIMCKH